MILIRFFLISLIVYLIVRSFIRFSNEEEPSRLNKEPDKKNNIPVKKISKEVGEYIDYEDVDEKK
jgi:large-conductance mechanosensitive channel